jgi:hypothetical protein
MMVIEERTRDQAERVLEPSLEHELLAHEGRWVAVTRSELVAVGDSADEVIRRASERGVEHPIVYFVPRDGHSSMFF